MFWVLSNLVLNSVQDTIKIASNVGLIVGTFEVLDRHRNPGCTTEAAMMLQAILVQLKGLDDCDYATEIVDKMLACPKQLDKEHELNLLEIITKRLSLDVY